MSKLRIVRPLAVGPQKKAGINAVAYQVIFNPISPNRIGHVYIDPLSPAPPAQRLPELQLSGKQPYHKMRIKVHYGLHSNGTATQFGVRCLGTALTAAARRGVWERCE